MYVYTVEYEWATEDGGANDGAEYAVVARDVWSALTTSYEEHARTGFPMNAQVVNLSRGTYVDAIEKAKGAA